MITTAEAEQLGYFLRFVSVGTPSPIGFFNPSYVNDPFKNPLVYWSRQLFNNYFGSEPDTLTKKEYALIEEKIAGSKNPDITDFERLTLKPKISDNFFGEIKGILEKLVSGEQNMTQQSAFNVLQGAGEYFYASEMSMRVKALIDSHPRKF